MGLILDSCAVIAAERQGLPVRGILEQIEASHGTIDIGLSVVTVAELIQGAYRSKAATDRQRRLAFTDQLCTYVPVYPFTIEMARDFGRIEDEQGVGGRNPL